MRVPRLTETQIQPTTGPRVRVDAPIDTGVAQTSQVLQQVGQGIDAIAEREFKQAVTTQTLEADTAMAQVQNASLAEAQTRQGKNAFGLAGQYLPTLDQQAKKISEGIPTQAARKIFEQSWGQRRAQVSGQLERHEFEQRQRYDDDTAKAAVAQGVSDMSLYANDPQAMTEAERRTVSIINAQRDRNGWSDETAQNEARKAVTSGYGNAVASLIEQGNYKRAKDLLPFVPDDKRATFEKSIAGAEKDTQVQAILGEFSKSTSAGESALKGQSIDVRRSVNEGLSFVRSEKKRQYAKELAGLAENIALGKVDDHTDDQVMSLYERGALSVDELESTVGRVANAREKGIKEGAKELFARDAYTRGLPLNPTDDDVKKGVDKMYLSAALQPGSAESANFAADIAKKTNVVPSSLVDWARAGVLSENPQMATQAANAMSLIQEQAPRAYSFGVDEKTKNLVETLSAQTRSGVPPDVAFKNAQRLAQQTPEEQERLKKLYATNFKNVSKSGEANADALQKLLNSQDRYDPTWLGSAPVANPQLAAEFDNGVERYFRLSGDIDQARNMAFKDVQAKWQRTEVNGKPELMAYAPDAMYGIGRDLIDADLRHVIAENKLELDPSRVKLIPTPSTDRTHGMRWALGYEGEYGDVEPLTLPGGQEYQLPTKEGEIRSARETIAAQALTEARARQEQLRKQLDVRSRASARRFAGDDTED
jgi:hypothetical protein